MSEDSSPILVVPAVAVAAPVQTPSAAFLLAHPAHAIALGFGSGLSRIAPGTVGTLWAWLAFYPLQQFLSAWQIGAVLLAATALGWWACTVTAKNMQIADSGHIVWDEIVAFWLVLWVLTPASLGVQAAAFLAFRAFDAIKIGPMAWADRNFKGFGARGGWGIMLDDLLAAFCTLLVMAWWRHL